MLSAMRRLGRESSDRLALSDRELREAVREEHGFIERLEAVLRGGDHEEKRAAVERAVTRVTIASSSPLAVEVRCALRGAGQ